MQRYLSVRYLLAGCAVAAGTLLAQADNWPQWRGPTNDGICKETHLPAEWGAAKNVLWKLPLPGQSGATPAIWGDRLFIPSEDATGVVLLCVGTDGKERWKRPIGPGKEKFMQGEGNQASPSPSTDGQHVYVFSGAGDFVCFNFEGKEVWRFNAQERYGKFNIWHGMHVTPLLHGDRLYHALLHSNGHWVIALDKATGKEVWKVERKSDARKESEQSYASPILWTNGKDEYLVIHGCDYTTAHKLTDGSEIWRVGDLNPKGATYNEFYRFVTTPVATPDLIVVPTAKGGPVVGVKPDAQGMVLPGSPYELWRKARTTPDVSSPVVQDSLVYLCKENGVLFCLDAKTGEERYQKPLVRGRYRASPVYADGKIYCTARDGTTSVIKAGPAFELLATNKLPDEIAASPAIANGRIYLRGFTTLYAIGAEGK